MGVKERSKGPEGCLQFGTLLHGFSKSPEGAAEEAAGAIATAFAVGASAPEADTSAGPTASSLLKFTDLTKAFLPPPFFPITHTMRDESQADHAKRLITFLEMECVCKIFM